MVPVIYGLITFWFLFLAFIFLFFVDVDIGWVIPYDGFSDDILKEKLCLGFWAIDTGEVLVLEAL